MKRLQLVVADTGPLNYLILTGDIELLPALFAEVRAPRSVCDELVDPDAPAPIRAWMARAPSWLKICPDPPPDLSSSMADLDSGEQAAIALAIAVGADLMPMDDREGVAAARGKGLAVTGTLGVLDLAARHGLIDLAQAFERLKATSFYYRQGLLDALLAQDAKRKS